MTAFMVDIMKKYRGDGDIFVSFIHLYFYTEYFRSNIMETKVERPSTPVAIAKSQMKSRKYTNDHLL